MGAAVTPGFPERLPGQYVPPFYSGRSLKGIDMKIAFAVCLLSLTGCAFTNVSSYKDPSFNDRKITKVLMLSAFQDIGARQRSDQAGCDRFKEYGVDCIPGTIFLPPTQPLPSKEELLQRCKENGIDSYFVLAMVGAGTSESYVPQSSQTQGQFGPFGQYRSTTQTYGGYNVSKPHASFEAKLVDVETGKPAWVATPNSRGNAFADYDDLVMSVIRNSIDKIATDGFTPKQRTIPSTTAGKSTSGPPRGW